MAEGEKTIINLIEVAKKIRERLAAGRADDEFDSMRSEAGRLIQELAGDTTNSATVQKIIDCVRKFESLKVKDLSGNRNVRSIVNQAVLSSRVKSTHYSAFIAGKYGESDQIGPKFKCWIYNVAAHGAIESAVLIGELIKGSKKATDKELTEVAKLFRSSAISDAGRFLEWSRKHDENSALRVFNSARIDVISNDPDRVRIGIKRLGDLESPADDCEAPDICWHEDNWSTFCSDAMLQDIIKIHAAQKAEHVRANLEKNFQKAARLREDRGDIWRNEHRRNNAAIASFGAVMLAVGTFAYNNPIVVADACDFSKDLLDYLQAIFGTAIDTTGTIVEAKLGDGGLAGPMRFARAVFGDGGLA